MATPLKTWQQNALAELSTLLAGLTGIDGVGIDPVDSFTPGYAVVFDEGVELPEGRGPQFQVLSWHIDVQLFVGSETGGVLSDLHKTARDLRGDLIDALDANIKLGNTITNAAYRGPVKVARLEYNGIGYIGVDCPYTLEWRTAKAYA